VEVIFEFQVLITMKNKLGAQQHEGKLCLTNGTCEPNDYFY
jgi:hypothetical protein